MTRYDIGGMSCAACSARVEKAVGGVEGVTSCSVSLLTNSMTVEGSASPEEIISAVERAGYSARAQNASHDPQPKPNIKPPDEVKPLFQRFVISLVLLLILMYFSMGHAMWGFPLPSFFEGNPIAIALVQLILSAAIMVINKRFFISGFRGLIHRSPNMDTLVSLGSAASFVWSVYELFMMTVSDNEAQMKLLHGLYFESAAMILVLITLGKILEARSKGKTTDALRSLMDLSPKTAVIESDGAEKEIPIDDVQVGDMFILRPGMSVPVDGVVIDGESSIDESMLTGESIPVDKSVDSKVYSATINQSGFLRCRATRVGEDTTLSQIIRTVYEAGATKAPIARLADKVSGVFVPVVMAIAAVTFIIWLLTGAEFAYALERGISVLVISCPCALGLATPVSIMVGNGVGAKAGILFRNAEALETAGKTQIIALDKTGTVTKGAPEVTDVIAVDGTEDELLQTAYSIEKLSSHPLAKAVTEYAEAHGVEAKECTGFKNLPGHGLTGVIDGEEVYAGSAESLSLSSLSSLSAERFVGERLGAPASHRDIREAKGRSCFAYKQHISDRLSPHPSPYGDTFPTEGKAFREEQAPPLQNTDEHCIDSGVSIHPNAVTDNASADPGPDSMADKGTRAKSSSLASLLRNNMQLQSIEDSGKTPMLFTKGGRLLGIIAAADAVKDDSREAVQQLNELGIRTVMITGDNPRTANAVGSQVGIDRVYAGVLPEGKSAIIDKLRQYGRTAMAGDGINDAPALTSADTGIAVGSGSDIAIESADVVLVGSSLKEAAAAVRLSRQTLRNIRQNLFWAFIYNIIGIPLAAGLWIPVFGISLSPMFGAAAMSLSSVCVVSNALRLNLFDPHKHKKCNTAAVELPDSADNITDKGEPTMIKTTVKVEGMMCPMCEKHVNEALQKAFSVESVTSSHDEGTSVIISSEPLDTDKVMAVINEAGYKAISADARSLDTQYCDV